MKTRMLPKNFKTTTKTAISKVLNTLSEGPSLGGTVLEVRMLLRVFVNQRIPRDA
jgi:hypothetical protein